jgi:hypothetical protein
MPLITGISNRIVALELGQVVTVDTPEKVINDPRVVESYLGGDLDVIHRSGTGEGKKPTARTRRPLRAKRTKGSETS